MGVCPPLREPLMLGPIVDALRPYGQRVPGLRLSALAGALRPLFPEWSADLPPAPEPMPDARGARHRLYRALADLLDRLGAEVLVVEDAHWADVATLEFLLFLTSRWQPATSQGRPGQPATSQGRPADGVPGPRGAAPAGAASRLSLVVTYRPEEVAAAEPAPSLLLLSSRPPVGGQHLRIPLLPLDRADTAELVSSMLDGGPVSDAFAQFLHERTDGIPLAVEESVRLLRDRGDVLRRDGEWVRRRLEELQVPPTVRDAVVERVRRLSEPAQRVLQAAAVLAEPAGEQVVATVAEVTEEQARAGLAETTGAGLLREDGRGRVEFRHVLVGQAVYETIPPVTRRRLHRFAGHALEAADPLPLAQLTRHFRAADETGKWLHYTELTADWAIESGDNETALARLSEAVAAAHAPAPARIRLACKLAAAARSRRELVDSRHRQIVGTLRDLLEAVPVSQQQEAELRNGIGWLLGQVGDLSGARVEIERAVPLLAHDPVEEARAMRLLGLPFVGPGPAADYRRWLERAAEVDIDRLPPADRLALIVDRAAGLIQLGDETGWQIAAQLPAGAEELGTAEERRQLTRGWYNTGIGAVVWGRYAQARRLLAAADALAEAERYERILPQIRVTRAELDWHMGAWDGVIDRIRSSVSTDQDRPMTLLGATRAGLWHLAQGANRKAEAQLNLALDQARQAGAMDDALEPAAALARIRLLEGRVAEALRETEQPWQTIVIKQTWVWATALAPVRVEALLAAGQVACAAEVVAAYRHGLAGCCAPAGEAALATCQALLAEARAAATTAGQGAGAAKAGGYAGATNAHVEAAGGYAGATSGHVEAAGGHAGATSARVEAAGGYAGAAARFAEAARAWERLPRPYDALLARERRAGCLLAAGQREPGVAELSAVFQALCELGARGDAERVAGRLRELGVAARREWRRGRRGYGDRLSPRELDVVRLVATGATNREVAAALSRSPKTVAGQLSSAMRKLGATSRTELAVAALRDGLVEAG